MNIGILGTTDAMRTKRFYHGTRAELKVGDLIEPSNPPKVGERDRITTYVNLTPNLDAAIWEAELAVGEGPGRVYMVEPIGKIEDASDLIDPKSPGNPSMCVVPASRCGSRARSLSSSLPWHPGRSKTGRPD